MTGLGIPPKLFIWKLERTDRVDYDEHDSFVIVAMSETDARRYEPNGELRNEAYTHSFDAPWARQEDILVTLVGEASPNLSSGTIICASFNAG